MLLQIVELGRNNFYKSQFDRFAHNISADLIIYIESLITFSDVYNLQYNYIKDYIDIFMTKLSVNINKPLKSK